MTNNAAQLEDLVLSDLGVCAGCDGSTIPICGKGTWVLPIQDDEGQWHTLRIPDTLYIPGLKRSLLCPQHWSKVSKDFHPDPHGTCEVTSHDGTTLYWSQKRYKRFIPLHPSTNTPVFYSRAGTLISDAFTAVHNAMDASVIPPREQSILLPHGSLLASDQSHGIAWGDDELINSTDSTAEIDPDSPCPIHLGSNHKWGECIYYKSSDDLVHITTDEISVDESSNATVTAPPSLESPDRTAELLRHHYRMGHLSFDKLKLLAKLGIIPRALADVPIPKCAGCLFGAMTRKPWRNKSTASQVFPATRPGQTVSVDQMQSTAIGFLAQLKGKLTKSRYTCATVFVDHYSRYRYVHLQSSMSSAETLAAKNAFELHARSMGVEILHYQADNGRFQDNAFKDSCTASGQRLSFCSVNAHHQNGICERAIRDLTDQARKMLLFAMEKWPQAVDLSLWPYAFRTACFIHNQLPCDNDGKSRLELFSGTSVMTNLSHFHTFGCPVYALNNDLASGKSIQRWLPRSRLGLYIGPSPNHARSVSLVLNLSTGLVSPQFHVHHDDLFETITKDSSSHFQWKYAASLLPGIDASNASPPSDQPSIQVLRNTSSSSPPIVSEGAGAGSLDNPSSDNNQAMPDDWVDLRDINSDEYVEVGMPSVPEDTAAEGDPSSLPPSSSSSNLDSASSLARKSADLPPISSLPQAAPTAAHHNGDASPPPATTPSASSRGRLRKPSQRFIESSDPATSAWGRSSKRYVASSSATSDVPTLDYDAAHDEHLLLQDRMRHPIAFMAEMVGDIMYYHQAIRQPDAVKFEEAIIKEVNGHVDNESWVLIPREEVPPGQEVVPSVWSMRRKRDLTTGEVTKYKARLNLHGGKQTFGVNYFNTWSPVVGWFSVRLLICLAMIQGWSIRQMDFVQAFVQAPIEFDMYMELPHGITVEGGSNKTHVLKLLANVYGQKQGSKVWYDYLAAKLESIGFTRSTVDECIFFRGTTIFIAYVDDALAFDMNGDVLDTLLQELRDTGLRLDDMGHPSDYIGVNLSQEDGVFNFTQRALIDSILKDVGLENSRKSKPVPAKSSQILQAFPESPPFDGPFNIRSVVGKLNYLAQTTRPDIMQAVHAIAKFVSNPRKEHGEAVMYLCMYLNKTRDIGLKFKPDPSKGFEDYCDADFIGQYDREYSAVDPSTAKSRSGWIVFYAGCPIIWASKLQTQVALSTTEAEYISLSMSLRDVIPIMSLISEIKSKGFDVPCTEPHVYCKLFEDNSGALELARLPKMRPRTKHLCASLHHFREHVRLGLIKIFPIATDLQTADILTKPTPQNVFVPHRIKMCGS